MRLRHICWLAALIAIVVALQGHLTVSASSPSPAIGKIAFVSTRDGSPKIYIMDADGSNQHRLIDMDAEQPAWSWDGTQIAFSSIVSNVSQIFIVNASGSDLRQITHDQSGAVSPAFSPDDREMVYESFGEADNFDAGNVYEMNVDGSNPHPLNDYGMGSERPSYSPDGSAIVYIFYPGSWPTVSVMARRGDFINKPDSATIQMLTVYYKSVFDPAWSADGNFIVYSDNDYLHIMRPERGLDDHLIGNGIMGWYPTWSPDGDRLAFASGVGNTPSDIYTVDIDGTNLHKLTQGGNNEQPAWQPQPIF